ncbi:LysM peptidoglycan-binding domain-containing protein [Tepidibacter formicigenes]|jgi:LysM repeat protein|uniref:LysM repeat-containing protein n=1 Tax=Tepidibacter formicigenes DSM 15518 TaxID=1123349 RepID=A0A1M6SFQ0_9FIRM|nr:LysM peptidoglycan-binding domain-containing protein [Tepidibacter formicigenes]SHK43563.1 LysM repeat-containing protein [Tepidibacter formicigenes DSM 15518]
MKKLMKKMALGSVFFYMIGCTSPIFAMNYTVQPNDTYWKISQKYNVDIDELLKVNNAKENPSLEVGQEIIIPEMDNLNYYEVKSGDTAWIISQKFNVSLSELLKINNMDESSVLYIGQKLKIPSVDNDNYYEVKSGDTAWIISQKFNVSLSELLKINNMDESSVLYIGQKLKIPNVDNITEEENKTNTIKNQINITITYIDYTIKSGDNFWSLSLKYGIPYQELLDTNNATSSTILNIGDVIKVPQHNIPVMDTIGEQYGEYLDWWDAAQYVIPIGAEFKVVDFNTGKSFMAKRTYGANHADVETLTLEDTKIMKEIWGGSWSWVTRPVILEYNGRKVAASASGMPHAGNDVDPANVNTNWRSGDYGFGINFDSIKGNGMDGHFDIHFLNSTSHNTGKISESHQKSVKISAGIIVE